MDDRERVVGRGMKRLIRVRMHLHPNAMPDLGQLKPKCIEPRVVNLKVAGMAAVLAVNELVQSRQGNPTG